MVMRGQLDPLVEWMREQGVRRVRLPDGLEVELDVFAEERRREAESLERASAAMDGRPDGFEEEARAANDRPAPIASTFADVDGAGVCSCGHSWLDHSEAGCLHGCSHEVCTSSATVAPEPSP
jgi:hypothetical protein